MRKTEAAFRKRFRRHRIDQVRLNGLSDTPESAVAILRAAAWRKLLKNRPAAKLRRAGNPRIRRPRVFPRTGR